MHIRVGEAVMIVIYRTDQKNIVVRAALLEETRNQFIKNTASRLIITQWS